MSSSVKMTGRLLIQTCLSFTSPHQSKTIYLWSICNQLNYSCDEFLLVYKKLLPFSIPPFCAISLSLSLCVSLSPLMMTSWQCVSPAAPSGPPAQQGPLQVNVPRYLLRGQGKDEHYEYEVKVSLQSCMDSSTSLFRYIYIDLYI